jgi:hypothetical protein
LVGRFQNNFQLIVILDDDATRTHACLSAEHILKLDFFASGDGGVCSSCVYRPMIGFGVRVLVCYKKHVKANCWGRNGLQAVTIVARGRRSPRFCGPHHQSATHPALLICAIIY